MHQRRWRRDATSHQAPGCWRGCTQEPGLGVGAAAAVRAHQDDGRKKPRTPPRRRSCCGCGRSRGEAEGREARGAHTAPRAAWSNEIRVPHPAQGDDRVGVGCGRCAQQPPLTGISVAGVCGNQDRASEVPSEGQTGPHPPPTRCCVAAGRGCRHRRTCIATGGCHAGAPCRLSSCSSIVGKPEAPPHQPTRQSGCRC